MELQREKLYIGGFLKSQGFSIKAQEIASNNIYKLHVLHNKVSDINSDFTMVDDININDDDNNDHNNYNKIILATRTILKTCVFCLTHGHWGKNCELIPQEFRTNCFKCWRSGHFTKNCTLEKMTKPPWMNEAEFNSFKEQIIQRRNGIYWYIIKFFS